jgi:hypothetical protein
MSASFGGTEGVSALARRVQGVVCTGPTALGLPPQIRGIGGGKGGDRTPCRVHRREGEGEGVCSNGGDEWKALCVPPPQLLACRHTRVSQSLSWRVPALGLDDALP